MLSGAYSTTVDVSAGASVSFSLKAAEGTQGLAEYAITSAVFWDGPANSVGDYALSKLKPFKVLNCCCIGLFCRLLDTTSTAYRAFGLQLRPGML